MIDKSSLLKSQGSLYLEFIPKDGLFHKMLLLSLMGFLTGLCNPHVCFAQCDVPENVHYEKGSHLMDRSIGRLVFVSLDYIS